MLFHIMFVELNTNSEIHLCYTMLPFPPSHFSADICFFSLVQTEVERQRWGVSIGFLRLQAAPGVLGSLCLRPASNVWLPLTLAEHFHKVEVHKTLRSGGCSFSLPRNTELPQRDEWLHPSPLEIPAGISLNRAGISKGWSVKWF